VNVGLYLHQARRWVLMAILPAVLVTLASYLYTKHEPKTYQTSAILYVQQPESGGTVPGATDIYGSQAVIPTYSQMITSPVIAQEVDRAMAPKYPGYRLEGHGLSVGQSGSLASQPNTQLMSVTVQDTVPSRAAAAADAVARVFIKKITAIQKARFKGGAQAIQRQLDQAQINIQYVTQRITAYKGPAGGLANLRAQLSAYQSIYQTLLASSQEFSVGRDTALNSVQIFSPAPIPGGPIAPNPRRNAELFGFLALILCAGGIFVYDYFDDSPRTPEEVEEIVGAPVLGTVHEFDRAKYGTELVTAKHGRSPIAEAYRIIRTNLQFIDVDRPARSILVSSASPTEGKSTTVSNLANVFAEAGSRVTLVDGDLRRPNLHRIFGLDRERGGLTSMLVGKQELNGLGVQQTSQDNLVLLSSGPLPPRPADLLGSSRMKELVGHLARQTDVVLIDSPPVLAVTDATILSTVADGVILVVDPSKSKRRDLRRAREAIEAVGGRILGVVINRLNRRGGSTYYYYYYQHHYGYQDRYGYGADREKSDAQA